MSAAAPAFAAEVAGLQLHGSGFLTAAVGRVLSGTHDPETDLDWRCPCYVSDYSRAGVYESGRWRFGPDSRVGLQGTAVTSDGRYALTAQMVSRGAKGGRANLEWLYASAELSSTWTLQLGRKRLPLLAYSEVQDVGHAYPWVNLPPQLYGWDIVNFNGASLLHRDRLVGEWFSALHLFAGRETVRDSRYWKLYNGKHSRTDVRWTGLAGAELKVGRDGFETRLVHIRTNVQERTHGAAEDDIGWSPRYAERISGVALHADHRDLVAHVEWLYINRTQQQDVGARDHASMQALGWRIGPWLPLVAYSRYQESRVVAGGDEGHRTLSFVLRYDVDASSAVKIQYSDWRDRSRPGFESPYGNARLIAISYDKVF